MIFVSRFQRLLFRFLRLSETRDSAARGRLFVDISTIYRSDAATGIQRVVREILHYLPQEVRGYDVIPVYASRHRKFCVCDVNRWPFTAAIDQVVAANQRVRPAAGDIFLGLDLSAHLLACHGRELREWRKAGTKIVIVVYDLLPLTFPDFFTDRSVANHKSWLRTVRKYADAAVCISADVAKVLVEQLSALGAHQVQVGHFTLGYDFRPQSLPRAEMEQHLPEQMARQRFVLMVGTVEPRKAYDVAIDAFEILWAVNGYDFPVALVIVGRPGWKSHPTQHRILNHPQFNENLFWIDSADDYLLNGLYKQAAMFLVTSLAEGFGLPLVEALAMGLPVLARDLDVFRETAGAYATFFSDDSPAELARSIREKMKSLEALSSKTNPHLLRWQEATRLLVRHFHFVSNSQCLDG